MGLNSSFGEVNLDALDATIADNAVDIFIYDTRKDSDGGKWRKRTKKTSWYNETLNTATRGSRRDFPAVAVIVAETSKVTIYDGDDPDMPMWMVFQINPYGTGQNLAGIPYGIGYNNNGGGLNAHNVSSVYMINGQLFIGGNAGVHAGWSANFLSEIMYEYLLYPSNASNTYRWTLAGNISQRNAGEASTSVPSSRYKTGGNSFGVKSLVNDVAMTVLPNAPVDPATQLSIPTIAVATNGGVSVIKDDGTVVDHIDSAGGLSKQVAFTQDGKLAHSHDGHTGIRIDSLKSSDFNYGANKVARNNSEEFYINYGLISSGWSGEVPKLNTGSFNSGGQIVPIQDNILAERANTGLNLLARDFPSSPSNNRVAYITSNYNTGWMHGDIKGAFLSDTDTTNVTGTELVTNGTFTTNTDGWTATNSTITIVSNTLKVDDNGGNSAAYQAITTVVGETYTISFDVVEITGLTARVHISTLEPNAGYTGTRLHESTELGSHAVTFIATGTTTYIQFSSESTYYVRYDNISVRIADPDRSVNNKGLQVFGTVTKTPVAGSGATAAELVGYRPPSGAIDDNYLSRPLTSSDFDLTSDWSITFWAKKNEQTANNYSGFEIAEDDLAGNNAYQQTPFSIYIDANGHTGWRGANVTGYQYDELFNTQDVWKCVTTVSKSGSLYIYINGEYVTSTPATFTNPSTPYSLGIFRFSYSESRHDGRRHIDYALFRMSNSAPSPEQIKKIYEDEKVLFQENAKCTLYGSSDAVTALAYDDKTNLLHVGTSSGRSDFRKLRRINNTTTGITTAISASKGLIAEQ